MTRLYCPACGSPLPTHYIPGLTRYGDRLTLRPCITCSGHLTREQREELLAAAERVFQRLQEERAA